MPKFATADPQVFNVPMDDVKQYVRISDDTDDSIVKYMMLFAEKYIRDECGLCVSKADLVARILPNEPLELSIPISPVVRVTSVMYGVNAISPTSYSLRGDNFRCSPFDRDSETVTVVSIQCGYGSPDEVPPDLRLAFMMIVARIYDNRGGDIGIVSAGLKDLLSSFRKFRF